MNTDVNLRQCVAIKRHPTLNSIVITCLYIMLLRYRVSNVYRKNMNHILKNRRLCSSIESWFKARRFRENPRKSINVPNVSHFRLARFFKRIHARTMSYHPRRDIRAGFPVVLDISDVRSCYRSRSKMKFARCNVILILVYLEPRRVSAASIVMIIKHNIESR